MIRARFPNSKAIQSQSLGTLHSSSSKYAKEQDKQDPLKVSPHNTYAKSTDIANDNRSSDEDKLALLNRKIGPIRRIVYHLAARRSNPILKFSSLSKSNHPSKTSKPQRRVRFGKREKTKNKEQSLIAPLLAKTCREDSKVEKVFPDTEYRKKILSQRIMEVRSEMVRQEDEYITMIHDLLMLSQMEKESSDESLALSGQVEALRAENVKAQEEFQAILVDLETRLKAVDKQYMQTFSQEIVMSTADKLKQRKPPPDICSTDSSYSIEQYAQESRYPYDEDEPVSAEQITGRELKCDDFSSEASPDKVNIPLSTDDETVRSVKSLVPQSSCKSFERVNMFSVRPKSGTSLLSETILLVSNEKINHVDLPNVPCQKHDEQRNAETFLRTIDVPSKPNDVTTVVPTTSLLEVPELRTTILQLIAERDMIITDYEQYFSLISSLVNHVLEFEKSTKDWINIDEQIKSQDVEKDEHSPNQQNNQIEKKEHWDGQTAGVQETPLKSQTTEIKTLLIELSDLKSYAELSKKFFDALEAEKNDMMRRFQETSKTINELRERIETEQTRSAHAFQGNVFEGENLREAKDEELENMKNELSVISLENTLLKDSIAEVSTTLHCSEKDLAELRGQVHDLHVFINGLKIQNNVLLVENGELHDLRILDQENVRNDVWKLEDELKTAREIILRLQTDNLYLSRANIDYCTEVDNIRAEIVASNDRGQNHTVDDMQHELLVLRDIAEQFQADKEVLNKKYMMLFEQVAELDGYNSMQIGKLMEKL
jgi:hypothetical protein